MAQQFSRIGIVSFEFGVGPEGVCTERLARALSQRGVQTEVLTSHTARSEPGELLRVRRLHSLSGTPARMQYGLGRLLFGIRHPHWGWAFRIARAGVDCDILYARANPLISSIAARKLARRAGLPLAVHFSDPVPSPWDENHPDLWAEKRRTVAPILEQAFLLTFTTPEALNYMERTYDRALAPRSTIIPNIVPDWPDAPQPLERPDMDLLYAGQFNGQRTPLPLIAGLRRFARSNGPRDLTLTLAGTTGRWVDLIRSESRGDFAVRRMDWSPNVAPLYSAARITLVIDAPDSHPVFLATKFGEALHAGRTVLVITPPDSPASKLCSPHWRSVRACGYSPDEIAESLQHLFSVQQDDIQTEVPLRRARLAPFRGPRVAATLLSALDRTGGYSTGRFARAV